MKKLNVFYNINSICCTGEFNFQHVQGYENSKRLETIWFSSMELVSHVSIYKLIISCSNAGEKCTVDVSPNVCDIFKVNNRSTISQISHQYLKIVTNIESLQHSRYRLLHSVTFLQPRVLTKRKFQTLNSWEKFIQIF